MDNNFDEQAYLAANPDVAKAVASGNIGSGFEHYRLFGRKENRALKKIDSRGDKVMAGLDPKGLGLEIGPSHNPIAPKKAGYNVHILDHLDAEGLRKKYAPHTSQGVNLDNIEEVDFVWSGQPLTELIGRTSCYDWIIASHVIEHIPDVISFLQQCEELLKPEGRISLVIPDKRYCFDYYGQISTTGDFLDAYHEKKTRPSPGQVFDHFANVVVRSGAITWGIHSQEPLSLLHTFEQAQELWNRTRSTDEYIDVHCWRFVLESFGLLVDDLRRLGLIRMFIIREYETVGFEFYATLAKGSAVMPRDRSACLSKIAKS